MEVLILEGGYNEEHEVSLVTARQVKKVLKKNQINYKSLVVNPKTFEKDIRKYKKNYICFNALHGPFGEDGKIQKILKKHSFKYTHSGIYSSKICFSKAKSKKKLSDYKILTPNFSEIKLDKLNEKTILKFKKKFNKFIVKPNQSGSSFGIKIVKNKSDLVNLLQNLKKYKIELQNHKSLLFEEFVDGKELTVSVIHSQNIYQPLAVTEIISKNSFFDYKSKYSKGYSKHILPARIPNSIYNKCLNYASVAHKVLKCNAISRTDLIYNKNNNKVYYLETNTQPGLTPISLVPEQAKYKNFSFENIIMKILNKTNE
ncbi:MAG: D-alanine--D-alanine ligase [Rickettsiales bacterium]|nr:D-alanine--D-alanine ligase [Rickettsiales bacterium]|tara:strand:+ start:668 stop:1612 length:945 start_codon:yes stop_codon:yes gene_type:complete